jgi:phospholipid/cholesterol/gamma-HCH transport system ATP-binding protein
MTDQSTFEASHKEEPIVFIKGVSKAFGELEVLKDIDFSLYRGENIAVLGKSGSGKSVLIKMMVGLLKPDSGQMIILGQEPHKLGSKELDLLRIKIGFSFQNSALYDSMNIFQNLAFPLKMNMKTLTRREVEAQVMEALDAVGLKEKINQMPADLSGGQRKRIGIARTLILKPEIMLYDEPTSGLDPVTSNEINMLINEVQQRYNTSAIIITHDLTCAKSTAHRVAMLLDGRFAKVETFEEVFESDDPQISSFYNYNFIQ